MMVDCTSPGTSTVPCPGDLSMFSRSICALLPRGWAWEAADIPGTIMNGRVKSLAALFQMLHEWACTLPSEFHCFSADKTLEDWYADYGLPDNCGLNDLCAKVISVGGQNCSSFIELGELLGFDLCCEDIDPELQCGCWYLGQEQLGPQPKFLYGGSELGYSSLGDCPVESGININTGQGVHGPDDCNIAGYYEVEVKPEEEEGVCGVNACVEFQPTFPTLLTGCHVSYDISHYTGTAHHWIVGLTTDNAGVGAWGHCEPFDGLCGDWCLGQDSLGKHVPGTPVAESYAISGCWDIGISELCTPEIEPIMCFIQRFKPAHTVAVRRYCDQNGVLK